MAKYTGHLMELRVGATNITNLITVDITETGEAYDVTAAGDDNMEYLNGHIGGTATINFIDDSAEVAFDLFVPSVTAQLAVIFYPQGNSTGKPARAFSAIVTSRQRGVSHNAGTPVNVQLQISGAITDSVVV